MFARWLARIGWLVLALAVGVGAYLYLTPPQQAAPPTVQPTQAEVKRLLLLRGRLQPLVETQVISQLNGHIVGQAPDLGQKVNRGDRLIRLKANPDFVAKVSEALSLYQAAEQELKRAGRVAVKAPSPGRVDKVLVRSGGGVKAGQALAELDGGLAVKAPRDGKVQTVLIAPGDQVTPNDALPMFYLAPSEVRTDSYDWRGAGELLRRFWSASLNLELLELLANRKYRSGDLPLDQAFVTAPVDGMISWRSEGLLPGALLAAKQPLLKLTSRERILVCKVHEVDYPKITPGQKSVVRFDAYPELAVPARLIQKDLTPQRSIFDQFSEYLARFSLERVPPQLIDGMSANLWIALEQRPDVLSLPLSAVIFEDKGTSVVVWEHDQAVRVPVRLGMQGEERAELLEGLDLQARVVVHPQRLDNLPPLSRAAAGRGDTTPAQ